MPTPVVILAPSPLLTVTVEDRAGEPDIHVHAGGQGVWQARMISSLGVPVVLCAGLGGETGHVLAHLIPSEGVTLHAVPVEARNGGYVHDRRAGEREVVAHSPGAALGRHEQDALYELTLREGLRHGFALLSGPHDDHVLPDAVYRRLATDLGGNGVFVAADLAGSRLDALLDAAPALVKVSHEELLQDGRADDDSPAALIAAMRAMRKQSAGTIVVSRAADPALALVDDDVVAIHLPTLEPAETMGAGDSMTAGMVATLADGGDVREALRIGAACGALNTVRHGLGSGGADAVQVLSDRITLVECDDEGNARA